MKQSLLVPSARAYVKSAIATLGLPGGAVGKAYVSTPYIGHAIAQWFTCAHGFVCSPACKD
jgi:17beta-estradiol 17-dehydrogenase / very-long-chain 3-oxoacyl-CoA reductase